MLVSGYTILRVLGKNMISFKWKFKFRGRKDVKFDKKFYVTSNTCVLKTPVGFIIRAVAQGEPHEQLGF